MVYKYYKLVKMDDMERINKLLAIKDLSELNENTSIGAKPHDHINLFDVTFENGNTISVEVCSGSQNYYENIVLFDNKNNEIAVLDPNNYIGDEIKLLHRNDTYIIEIRQDVYGAVLNIKFTDDELKILRIVIENLMNKKAKKPTAPEILRELIRLSSAPNKP